MNTDKMADIQQNLDAFLSQAPDGLAFDCTFVSGVPNISITQKPVGFSRSDEQAFLTAFYSICGQPETAKGIPNA